MLPATFRRSVLSSPSHKKTRQALAPSRETCFGPQVTLQTRTFFTSAIAAELSEATTLSQRAEFPLVLRDSQTSTTDAETVQSPDSRQQPASSSCPEYTWQPLHHHQNSTRIGAAGVAQRKGTKHARGSFHNDSAAQQHNYGYQDELYRQQLEATLALEPDSPEAPARLHFLAGCVQMGRVHPWDYGRVEKWISRVCDRIYTVLDTFTLQELASLTFVMGQLGMQPPDNVLARLAIHARTVIEQPELVSSYTGAVLLLNIAEGWALLGHCPGQIWVEQLMTVLYDKLDCYNSRLLSRLFGALAALNAVPDEAWRDAAVHPLKEALLKAAPHNAAVLLDAAVKLRLRLPLKHLEIIAPSLEGKLNMCMGPELVTILTGLAAQGFQPSPNWLKTFTMFAWMRLPHLTAEQCARLLSCLARLGYYPGNHVLSTISHMVHRHAPQFTPLDAVQVVFALLKFKVKVRHLILEMRYVAAIHKGADKGSFGPQALGDVLWSLAELAPMVGRPLTRSNAVIIPKLLAEVQRQLPLFPPFELTRVLYGLARLGWRPPLAWTKRALQQVCSTLPAYEARELVTVVWALAELGVPGTTLEEVSFLPAATARISALPLPEGLWLSRALADAKVQQQPEWLMQFAAGVRQVLLRSVEGEKPAVRRAL